MGLKCDIREAAEATGLTEHALRTGIAIGKYPYIKVGRGRGHILIDLELLNQALEAEALQNQAEAAERYKKYCDEKNTMKLYKGSYL